jgi:hypothetical protein
MGYVSRLLMSIRAQDQSKRELAQVSRNLQKTGRAGSKAGKSVAASWRSALGVMRGAAAAYGVVMVKQMADAGRASLAVEAAFVKLNKSSGQLLKTMRAKSGSLLDDTSLQKIANKLQAIGLSGAKMGEILEVSMKLAAQSGGDYLDVTQRLTQALITGETESFKTLGILVDSKIALATYAAENGKAVDALTKTEQAQAKVNEALKQAEKSFGDVDTGPYQDSLKRLETSLINFKGTVGRIVFDIGASFSDFVSGKNLGDALIAWDRMLGGSIDQNKAISAANKERYRQLRDLNQAKHAAMQAEIEYQKTLKATEAALQEERVATVANLQAYKDLIAGKQEVKSAMATVAKLQREETSLQEMSVAALEKRLAALRKAEAAYADTTKAIGGTNKAGTELMIGYLRQIDAIMKLLPAAKAQEAQAKKSAEALALVQTHLAGVYNLARDPTPTEQVKKFYDAIVSGKGSAIIALGEMTGKLYEMQRAAGMGVIDAAAEAATLALKLANKAKAAATDTGGGGGGGGAAATRPDQIPGLEDAKARALIDLALVEGTMLEVKAIEDLYVLDRAKIRRREMTDAETKLTVEELQIHKKIDLLKLEQAAQAETDRERQQGIADVLRAQQRADAAKKRMDSQRKAAEAKAAAAYQKNLDNTISITASGLKMFAGTQRAMNIIDAARETAQSIKSFALGDFFGGAAHAMAAASFIKAASIAGKHGGGGGGGSAGTGGAGAQGGPSTDRRFEGATDVGAETGGNVYNIYGFMGDEEKLGHYIMGTINVASQTGGRISDRAVDAMDRGY